MDNQAQLVFLPLGGAGEIGMNAYLYGFGPPDDRQYLLVDLGVSFAGPTDPGIDIILPDLGFLEQTRTNLVGIVLTHGHEDHYGAISHLWPRLKVPIYTTAFTKTLLMGRLSEVGLEADVKVKQVFPGKPFKLGPFEIEMIAMTHSIPEPMGLAISTELGTIFHSGDWKLDDAPMIGPLTDQARLKEIGQQGCLALICDSTNVLREGKSVSETQVAESLTDIIAQAKGRVMVTTFASNLGRLIAVLKAAEACGRSVVAAGRSMWRIIAAGRACGYLENMPPILDIDDFENLSPNNVVCLCTGSQGEPRAALARIAEGRHPSIWLDEGDVVIFSSRTIPGNEKSVARVHNNLARLGVDIITDDDGLVHTSGHPRRGELSDLYQWLKPEIIVPMHGEPRHLYAQAKFASEETGAKTLVAENGTMVRLAPGMPKIIDEAPAGRLHIDGHIITQADNVGVRSRRRMAYAGLVSVSLLCDKKGRLKGEPLIGLSGLPEMPEGDIDFEQEVLIAIDKALDAAKGRKVKLEELIRRMVRRQLEMVWGKKPICNVFIHRVGKER